MDGSAEYYTKWNKAVREKTSIATRYMNHMYTYEKILNIIHNNRMPLIHLSEWPKSGTLTIPNAGEDIEQQVLSYTADKNEK